jgi:hypothetical protein
MRYGGCLRTGQNEPKAASGHFAANIARRDAVATLRDKQTAAPLVHGRIYKSSELDHRDASVPNR